MINTKLPVYRWKYFNYLGIYDVNADLEFGGKVSGDRFFTCFGGLEDRITEFFSKTKKKCSFVVRCLEFNCRKKIMHLVLSFSLWEDILAREILCSIKKRLFPLNVVDTVDKIRAETISKGSRAEERRKEKMYK